jgi:exodeoxyribonuclease VII small subunit
MNSNNSSDIATISFEQALEKLEAIIAKLSDGKISLDEMIKLHDEANKLHNHCQKKLDEAKMQIEKIQP